MDTAASHLESLLELEARHEELLERLDDLNQRVEKVLAECAPAREGEPAAPNPSVESQ